MKQNKIVMLISIITTICAICLYFLDVFKLQSNYLFIKDLSLAVFSSSCFVLICSIVGYFIERKKLLDKILEELRKSQLIRVSVRFGRLKDNAVSYSEIDYINMMQIHIDDINKLIYCLKEFYNDTFFSKKYDKKLKKIIRNLDTYVDDIIPTIFISGQERNLGDLSNKNKEQTDGIITWLKNKKIKLRTYNEIISEKQ